MSTLNSTPVGFHATSPRAIASMAQMWEAMDETSDHAISFARIDRMSDDQRDVACEAVEAADRAEQLEDVRHEMRVLWNEALASLGGLNPSKLPIVSEGKVALVSFPEVLALCGETNHLYVLLANILRGSSPDILHIHLRTTWVDGFAEELLACGWQA